ncbi:TrmH family RNA methyltransferase [Terracidiphilus gabretensis]|uniref:TrmH family RNA methyltransferase n=1 Tax=Terracidiphilus gabretensis TaxID=1577687 RepID=UPI00071B4A74|nr:RNA methyltransferase [Terracidiphilus gabretensis]
MPVRVVQSKQNVRLKELRHALSKPPRPGDALAGIEGPNLIEEAVRARLGIEAVFVSQDAERLLDGLALPKETEVLLVPRELLSPVLTTEAPQPIAALVRQPDWIWRDLLEGFDEYSSALIVVLAGLQDPGNLGTIVRSAEAFGATGIVSLPGTVSAWNAKAVRASAGSIFRVPMISVSADECVAKLHESGVKIWATTVHDAKTAPSVNLTQPIAILIGNEGNGVPPELAAMADDALTIPCPGPVESLNAAVAASVLLYEAAQQRAAKGGAR